MRALVIARALFISGSPARRWRAGLLRFREGVGWMPVASQDHLITGLLPVIIVIAVGAVVLAAIVARLVSEIARMAIGKSSPDQVATVVLALGALARSFRWTLPWPGPGGTPHPAIPPGDPVSTARGSLHTEISPCQLEEGDHEA